MSRRLAVSLIAVAAFAVCSCGSEQDQGRPAVTMTETGAPVATPSATETTSTPASVSPSSPEPLGPITPTGRPTMTVPPAPVASIGAVCLQPADKARRVAFKALSGATLTGALLGSGRAGVVLVHQSDGNVCQWLPYARDLARARYLVLVIETEGRGSAGFVQYEGDQPLPLGLDVAGAVRFLRSQGAAKVVLVGASMGASAVLAGAAITRPAVNGVVSASAPIHAVGDARTAASRLTMPVLYTAATEDHGYNDTDYAAMARMLYKATKSPRSLLIVPGTAHGVALVQEPGHSRVRPAVDAFIAAHAR